MWSMMGLSWNSSQLCILLRLALLAVIIPGRNGHTQPSSFEQQMGMVDVDRRPPFRDENIPLLFRILMRNDADSFRPATSANPTVASFRYLIDLWQPNVRELNRPLPLFLGAPRMPLY
uniref:Uncharacterized protein n=1 Tax=Plectus sambesii TaxID=2011161 RepID=A0A914VWJ2_9BILA